MGERSRVFLDTSVVKHSIRSRRYYRPSAHQPEGIGQIVYDIVDEDPTSRVRDKRLRAEIDLLPRVAELARRREIELVYQVEALVEFLGIHMTPGGGSSELLRVATQVDPIPYERIIAGPSLGKNALTMQSEFLRGRKDPRFLELQRACGARQGDHVNENQLRDAFHIWCAEEAGATHFLTTDFKLIRVVRGHKTTRPRARIVAPTELLKEIGK